MSDTTKPKLITAAEFDKNSIKNMATRPTRPSAYGVSALSPQQVKEYFDKNPEMLKDKINEVIEYLPYLAADINVEVGESSFTLAELGASLVSSEGLRMQDLLKVDYGAEVKTLAEVIKAFTISIDNRDKEIIKLSFNLDIAVDRITDAEEDIKESESRIKANEEEIKILKSMSQGTIGLEYSLSADGTYYICEGGDIAGDIIIPSEYNGLPVKEIAGYAFYGDRRGYKLLTSVVIPFSIERIGESAFYAQWHLRKIVLKGKPISINGNSFDTNALVEIFPGEEAVPCDIYVPWGEGEVAGAPWGCDVAQIHYDMKTIEYRVTSLENKIGDIDTAFDELHVYAQSLVGGASE
jgi:hypothetical protein